MRLVSRQTKVAVFETRSDTWEVREMTYLCKAHIHNLQMLPFISKEIYERNFLILGINLRRRKFKKKSNVEEISELSS